MIRTKSVGGFCVFLLTITFLWFGIIVIDYLCLLYWFHQPDVSKRLISVIPTTNIGTGLFLIFNWFGYMSSVSHLRASFGDPGIITKDIKPPPNFPVDEKRECKKGEIPWKPIRAHHCSECQVCIFKMDHHCPWINSCVGAWNTKYFFLFTFYTGVGALLAIAILITSFILLIQDTSNQHVDKQGYPVAFFLCIVVLIESVLFSFFTLELVGEQLESFQDNQTYVDDLKDLIGIPYTLFEGFRAWIGEDWMFWLLPTRPELKIDYGEKLYRMQEIVTKKYMKEEKIEYDPSGKMKAICKSEAQADRMYFMGVTLILWTGAYCVAYVMQ